MSSSKEQCDGRISEPEDNNAFKNQLHKEICKMKENEKLFPIFKMIGKLIKE